MTEPLPLKRGDFVSITSGGHTLPGMIVLASANHVSLAVMFDGILSGHVGLAPLIWLEDHGYQSLTGDAFELIHYEDKAASPAAEEN